ncbi:MAG: type VI secretion system tube protein Hcp [Myxococcales bacterium]|nr:type VI secretion system tube protein Hcp [Myxococcales bacterium]
MAFNTFIKFTGPDMNAGSTSKGHEGWIEVLSWSHGFTQPTTPTRSHGGGATVEKAHHAPFNFQKILDSSTDDLLKACWSGKHIDKMEFVAYRSGGDTGASQMAVPYLKIELESCVITDYSLSGGPGDMPAENVSVNYAKVTYTYNGQDKMKGTVGADQPVSHDLTTNVVA